MARPRDYPRGLAWAILQYHFASRNGFMALFRTYEKRVLGFANDRGIPRTDLRLNPEETQGLFDTWRLKRLVDIEMPALADASHEYFQHNGGSDPYDSKISRIYHELAILFEEHNSVREFPRGGGHREFARLFREVSEYYPQRLRRVRDLFTRAQRRLEELLPSFAEDTIVLRSAYLFREELWPDSVTVGLRRFLGCMFPTKGVPQGFLRIAQSFLRAGFFDHATECARMGVATAGKEAQARSSRAKDLRETISELDRLIARAETERKALEEEKA